MGSGSTILDKIKKIEEEIARTQKNKATEYHLGLLKAKLAKFRAELISIDQKSSSSGGGVGFEAKKSGDARVVLIGFPSVGKSTLLNKITSTSSAVAAYEYTTLSSVPGVLQYKGADIQILDLPGIIEGAATGKGRGRQVIATARTADLVVMLCDATKAHSHKQLLTHELETFGLRLNKNPPKIYYKPKSKSGKVGGISYSSTCAQRKGVDEKLVREILHSYKIHNAEMVISEEVTVDDVLDAIEGKTVYVPCLYVFNKVDNISIEQLSNLALQDDSVVISAELELNLDELIDKIWEKLNLVRIYHKKKGSAPDFQEPSIFRSGVTIRDVCLNIHADMVSKFKYANVWGKSSKHDSQTVGLGHELADEDVVQIVAQN